MPYKDPELQRKYQREWYKKRRNAWLDKNGPCVDCGTTEHLEVDHVDPLTKVNHSIWSWSEHRRLEELKKCVVRCHSCHKRKSAGEKALGSDNGRSVLTEEAVREIRLLARGGLTHRQIANQFGAKRETITTVLNGGSWRWVQ